MKATTLPTLRERWKQIKSHLEKSLCLKSEFVGGIIYFEQAVKEYDKYIVFTSQKLALSQFVPCDSKGEPMEKPEKPMGYDVWKKGNGGADGIACVNYQNDLQEYQKALDACIFEGWEIDHAGFLKSENGAVIGVRPFKKFTFLHKNGVPNWKNIEGLITAGITLTLKPNHANELNL